MPQAKMKRTDKRSRAFVHNRKKVLYLKKKRQSVEATKKKQTQNKLPKYFCIIEKQFHSKTKISY